MRPTVELAELTSSSASTDEAAKKPPSGEVAPAMLAMGARPWHERFELSESSRTAIWTVELAEAAGAGAAPQPRWAALAAAALSEVSASPAGSRLRTSGCDGVWTASGRDEKLLTEESVRFWDSVLGFIAEAVNAGRSCAATFASAARNSTCVSRQLPRAGRSRCSCNGGQ